MDCLLTVAARSCYNSTVIIVMLVVMLWQNFSEFCPHVFFGDEVIGRALF